MQLLFLLVCVFLGFQVLFVDRVGSVFGAVCLFALVKVLVCFLFAVCCCLKGLLFVHFFMIVCVRALRVVLMFVHVLC